MNNPTKLLPLRHEDNIVMRNEVKKYLMMPLIEIIKLLVAETDAKNRAYLFIEKKGLKSEFKALK